MSPLSGWISGGAEEVCALVEEIRGQARPMAGKTYTITVGALQRTAVKVEEIAGIIYWYF